MMIAPLCSIYIKTTIILHAIFNITHSKEDLEDLIDDVFVKLIEKVSLIRNFECKLTTYIIYTIKSVSINHLKYKTDLYYSENTDILDDCTESGSEFDDRLIHQEDIVSLRQAVYLLPQRTCFISNTCLR